MELFSRKEKFLGIGCGAIIGIALLLGVSLGGVTSRYIVTTVVPWFGEVVPVIPFIVYFVVGVFFGTITIPASALVWLISFFM